MLNVVAIAIYIVPTTESALGKTAAARLQQALASRAYSQALQWAILSIAIAQQRVQQRGQLTVESRHDVIT